MRISIFVLLVGLVVASCGEGGDGQTRDSGSEASMQVHFLEIITPKVDETCALLGEMHGVEFSPPVAELANARTADLFGGGRISVRAPIPEAEPVAVVRPYMLVDDIHASVKQAEEAGATIAHPPLEIPGLGTFAIYFLGDIQHGLWQR